MTLRSRLLCLASLLSSVAGCGSSATNPCDGINGACLGARVEGSVTGLDQLRITIDKPMSKTITTPNPPSVFALPVKLALELPDGVTGDLSVVIEGLSAGKLSATSGPRTVTLDAGGRGQQTFTLDDASIHDGGAQSDDAAETGPDLLAPGIVVEPALVEFPDTQRGKPAMARLVKVTNNTEQAVSVSLASIMYTGDATSFQLDPTSACVANPTLQPHASCSASVQFTPAKSGDLSWSASAMLSTGGTVTIAASGKGTPFWALETAGSGELAGVWGSSPTDLYAVGSDGGGKTALYRSKGDGTWTPAGADVTSANILYAVHGYDAHHVWVGGDSAFIWFSTGDGHWTAQSMMPPSLTPIRGIWASPTDQYAVTDVGMIYHSNGSGAWVSVATTNSALYAIYGAGAPTTGTVAAVGLNGQSQFTTVGGMSFSPVMPTTSTLYGLWGAPNKLFAVGQAKAAGGPGTIGSYTVSPTSFNNDNNATPGDLYAISGRVDANQVPVELYAVGALQSKVLRSTGNGTWSEVPVPGMLDKRGVWVGPGGEVVTGGFGGEVNHLY